MDNEESVKIKRIGKDLTVDDSAEEVEFHLSRIKYIENLNHLKNLKVNLKKIKKPYFM